MCVLVQHVVSGGRTRGKIIQGNRAIVNTGLITGILMLYSSHIDHVGIRPSFGTVTAQCRAVAYAEGRIQRTCTCHLHSPPWSKPREVKRRDNMREIVG